MLIQSSAPIAEFCKVLYIMKNKIIICPNCHNEIEVDHLSNFCQVCGAPIKNEEELRRKAREIVTMYPKGYDYFVKYQSFPHFAYNLTAENCEKIIAKKQDIIKKHNEIVTEEERKLLEKEQRLKAEEERRKRIELQRQQEAERQRRIFEQKQREEQILQQKARDIRRQLERNVSGWVTAVLLFAISFGAFLYGSEIYGQGTTRENPLVPFFGVGAPSLPFFFAWIGYKIGSTDSDIKIRKYKEEHPNNPVCKYL